MLRAAKVAAVVMLVGAPVLGAQVTFDQAMRDLTSTDAGTRMHTAQMLKTAAYPEAAVPLATLVTDSVDEVQLEAIAAELNIFLAAKIVPRKRIGFVIETRNLVAAEPVFAAGPLAIGPRPVPNEVLSALRAAARDENPRVGLEALYAFGTLATETMGDARRELLRTSGPGLAALVGGREPAIRVAAIRVMGRVFERRGGDEPIEPTVGDAVITALNDGNRSVRGVAMQALGAMRYERGVQALSEIFQYLGKGELAETALDAVAHIAHPASAVLLTLQLTSKNPNLKTIGIEGLTRIGDRVSLAALDSALTGERNDAVLLAGQFAAAMLSNGPIDPITEALARSKWRDQARQYLLELAPGRALQLTRYVQDPDPRLRAEVIDALGLARDPAGLPVVEPMLKDPDSQVARAAERAVARLRAASRRPASSP